MNTKTLIFLIVLILVFCDYAESKSEIDMDDTPLIPENYRACMKEGDMCVPFPDFCCKPLVCIGAMRRWKCTRR